MLRAGPHYGKGSGRGYNTMKLALEDGAVIMSWGYVLSKSLFLHVKSIVGKNVDLVMDWMIFVFFLHLSAPSSTKSSTSLASVSRFTLLRLCTDGHLMTLSSSILSSASTAGKGSVKR